MKKKIEDFAMDKTSSESSFLYEAITRELNSIINESGSSKNHNSESSKKSIHKGAKGSESSVLRDIDDTGTKNQSRFLEGQNQLIDADIKKMQVNLQQSYEIFNTISDKFGAISFSSLRNRIKGLHLNNNKNKDYDEAKNQILHGIFEENYMNNRLDKLTTEVSGTFSKHSGEFGGIPEISAFLQACSQLQHGLEALKRQRNDVMSLCNRVDQSNEISSKRIDEIGAVISKDFGMGIKETGKKLK